MNIFLLGPQGSGKGTQARLLAAKYNLFYFESGDFLRELGKNNQELQKTMAAGQLVNDEEMVSYVAAFFDDKQIYDNIIFDGFPRDVEQYKFFKEWIKAKGVKVDYVFVLNIKKETTIERLSARRQDPATGKIYNLITEKPPKEIDSNKLVQREDDKPAAIEKRLQLYNQRTLPLIQELKKEWNVSEFNGEKPVEEIQKEMTEIIEKEIVK